MMSLPINCSDNVFVDLEFSEISYNFIIIIQLYNLCCYANLTHFCLDKIRDGAQEWIQVYDSPAEFC